MQPWFLVEVKAGDARLAPELPFFAKALEVRHAFQAVLELPFDGRDCFALEEPAVVPARTLLSQLL
jgi:hypothetical protein